MPHKKGHRKADDLAGPGSVAGKVKRQRKQKQKQLDEIMGQMQRGKGAG